MLAAFTGHPGKGAYKRTELSALSLQVLVFAT